MALVSQSIPDFLGGVSQQDERQRAPNQLEEQTNCLTDPAHGLMKRPPTVFDAQLEDDPAPYNTNPFVHTAVRDSDEKFRVILRNNDVKVFRLSDGQEFTVHSPEGTSYLSGSDYRALTLGNTTYIINQNKVVATADDEQSRRDPEALIFVRQGDYSTTYQVEVGPFKFAYKTPSAETAGARTEIETNEIARVLHNGLLKLSDFQSTFTSERIGSTLYFTRADSEEFSVFVRDGLADKGLLAVKDSVQRIEDLPLRARDGFTVEITGDQGTEYDNHWVVYDEASNPEDAGVWRETVAPGTKTKLDRSTMPHELVLSGSLAERATARQSPADPIVRDYQYSESQVQWDNVEDSGGTTSITTEQTTLEEHNSWVEHALDAGLVGEDVTLSVAYDVDTSLLDAGLQIVVRLDRDQGTGTWIAAGSGSTPEDRRVYKSGRQSSETMVTETPFTVASGEKIRLRMTYASGSTPVEYRRAAVTLTNLSAGGTPTDEADVPDEREPVFIKSKKATAVDFSPDREYPSGYQIRVTVDATNFDHTPSATETGTQVASAIQVLVDADAGYVAKVDNDGEVLIADASAGQAAPTVSVTQTFAPATHLWISEDSELDLTEYTGISGATVENITDGSTGTVTAVTADTLVVSSLTGGVDNTFEKGDLIKVTEDGNYFVFRPSLWRPREVGDLLTNPFPEFVGGTINDMAFVENRMAFVFDDKVHFSAAGDLLNLFRHTASVVRDDDGFGVTAANSVSTYFHSAVKWDRDLYLVGENGLVLVHGGRQPITPETIRMDFVGAYENSPDVAPIVSAQSLFMVRTNTQGTQILELRRTQPDIVEEFPISSQIPHYIEGTPIKLISSDAQGFLGVLCEVAGDNKLYTYRYPDRGRERLISAWSEWQFPSGANIVGMDLEDGIIGIVAQNALDVTVEELDLSVDPTLDRRKVDHLDKRLENADLSVVYNAPDTTITLPYEHATDGSDGTLVVYDTDSNNEYTVTGRPTTTTLTVSGDRTGDNLVVGIKYTQTIVPTVPFYFRDERGRPDLRGTLSMRFVVFNYHDSTDVTVKVTPTSRSEKTTTFDKSTPTDGRLRVPIMAQDYTLTITNDTPGPFNLSSLDWEAQRVVRSRR